MKSSSRTTMTEPRTIAQAAEQLKVILKIFGRLSRNRHFEVNEEILWPVLMRVTDRVLHLWDDILAHEPLFPSNLEFEAVWGTSAASLAQLSSWQESSLQQAHAQFTEYSDGVTSLETAFSNVEEGSWTEERFNSWIQNYWSPLVERQRDVQKVSRERIDSYVNNVLIPTLERALRTVRDAPPGLKESVGSLLSLFSDEAFQKIRDLDDCMLLLKELEESPQFQNLCASHHDGDQAPFTKWEKEYFLPELRRRYQEQMHAKMEGLPYVERGFIPGTFAHLFSIWDDVQWRDDEGLLYIRGSHYGQHLEDGIPCREWNRLNPDTSNLIGDATSTEDEKAVATLQGNGHDNAVILSNRAWGSWTKVTEDSTLKRWDSVCRKPMSKSSKAKEFLKSVNLTTYQELDSQLNELSLWTDEDGKKMMTLRETEWLGPKTYREERYFIREMKRQALLYGKAEIEKLLMKHGYEPEKEIKEFFNQRPETNEENERRRCEQEAVILAAESFVKKCKNGTRQIKVIPRTFPREFVDAKLPELTPDERRLAIGRVRARATTLANKLLMERSKKSK